MFHPNKHGVWLHLSLLESRWDQLLILAKALLPVRLPAVGAPGQDATKSRKMRTFWPSQRYAKYVFHVAFRVAFHLRTLPNTLWHGFCWWFDQMEGQCAADLRKLLLLIERIVWQPQWGVSCSRRTISSNSSTYVTLDSWIYPAFDRLHALGYADTAYMGLRPWTRLSCLHILEQTATQIGQAPGDGEATSIFAALTKEFAQDGPASHAELDELYSRSLGSQAALSPTLHILGRPHQ